MTKNQIETMIIVLLKEASMHTKEADPSYPPIYTSRMAASFVLMGIAAALGEAVK